MITLTTSFISSDTKTLVVYAGPQLNSCSKKNRYYHYNFLHFLHTGLTNDINHDFIIVITKEIINLYREMMITLMHKYPQLKLVTAQSSKCYDMESYRLALSHPKTNLDKYQHFIFLNCGLVGPFSSSGSGSGSGSGSWMNRLTNHLSEDVKLVGISMNCEGKDGVKQAHVQSMIFSTDKIGLEIIRSSNAIYDCGDSLVKGSYYEKRKARSNLINRYELGMSKAILEAGYMIKSIHPLQDNLTFSNLNNSIPFPSKCIDLWYSNTKRFDDCFLFERIGCIPTSSQYSKEDVLFWKNTRIELPIYIKDGVINQIYNPCMMTSAYEFINDVYIL